MDESSISIAAISASKLQHIADQAAVSVFKKALDQSGVVTMILLEGATKALPDGVGKKLDVVA